MSVDNQKNLGVLIPIALDSLKNRSTEDGILNCNNLSL